MDLSVNLLSLQIAAMVENHISSVAARCQLLFRFHQGLQLIFARGAQAGEDWKGQMLWGELDRDRSHLPVPLQNHRMVCVKGPLSPSSSNPLPWIAAPSTIPGFFNPCPIWP